MQTHADRLDKFDVQPQDNALFALAYCLLLLPTANGCHCPSYSPIGFLSCGSPGVLW